MRHTCVAVESGDEWLSYGQVLVRTRRLHSPSWAGFTPKEDPERPSRIPKTAPVRLWCPELLRHTGHHGFSSLLRERKNLLNRCLSVGGGFSGVNGSLATRPFATLQRARHQISQEQMRVAKPKCSDVRRGFAWKRYS